MIAGNAEAIIKNAEEILETIANDDNETTHTTDVTNEPSTEATDTNLIQGLIGNNG